MEIHILTTLIFILQICLNQSRRGEIDGIDKRLLLNDPDVSANRLLSLEKSVQTLMSTVVQHEGEIKSLKSELVTERSELQSLKSELSAAKIRNTELQTNLSETVAKMQNKGSTYVRWGRSKCPLSNTELVYSGYTAGQEYARSSVYGGPANLLCLPDNPELSNRTVPGNVFIYGSEFEENTFAAHSQQEDVPCAVCRSTNTVSSLMIPGRKTCYNGWKMAYQGILASGCYGCKASFYVCVDSKPEFIAGGERNNNNNLLYAVGTQCGSLPCPPYHNNLVTNCVVCSK